MDHEKREKLREYLRNNRPKNNINLGKKSNNKENSNKNLEDDLNSDNLNLNNNPDLDNSQISNNKTNSNKRDYDKEPLIIQSYEEFFFLIMFMASLILSLIISCFCKDLYKGSVIDFDGYIAALFLLVGYIFVVTICQKQYFSNHKIKFCNKYIEFYDYGKLKKQSKIVASELILPFSTNYSKNSNFDIADIIIYSSLVVLIIISKGFVFFIVISFYFSNLFIKFFIYLFINKRVNGFKIFTFIQIYKPTFLLSYNNSFAKRYYLIYLYNYEIYKEVKQYFLQKNIDIDNLPKSYNIF